MTNKRFMIKKAINMEEIFSNPHIPNDLKELLKRLKGGEATNTVIYNEARSTIRVDVAVGKDTAICMEVMNTMSSAFMHQSDNKAEMALEFAGIGHGLQCLMFEYLVKSGHVSKEMALKMFQISETHIKEILDKVVVEKE